MMIKCRCGGEIDYRGDCNRCGREGPMSSRTMPEHIAFANKLLAEFYQRFEGMIYALLYLLREIIPAYEKHRDALCWYANTGYERSDFLLEDGGRRALEALKGEA